jgi:hypothetical protein
MPFSNLAARPREDHPARPANQLAPPFYPIGLLPTSRGSWRLSPTLRPGTRSSGSRLSKGRGLRADGAITG